ncbi:MAG TPA: type II secretion system F family protein [Marmoricola sp.]|nr:type II secretion system F family protein [Marmoricola sp.]
MTPVAAAAAAGLAASAVLLLVRGPTRLPPGLARRRAARHLGLASAPAGAAVVALAAPFLLLSGHQLVLVLIAVGVGIAGLRLLERSRREGRAHRRAAQVLGACDAMAAELAAGQPALAALERAAEEWAELQPAASAARLGADVPAVLRDLGGRPGGGELRVLAAAWQVGHESGCGLGDAVATAATAIRERQATRRSVATELAAAHATARMMAVLPFGVLLLGAGVGGDPVGFLTGTAPGLGCLAAGLALAWLGLLWLHRIADQVLER